MLDKMPLVNPHATAVEQDEQIRAQLKWLKQKKEGDNKMEDQELKTWWDLTEDEQEDFRQYVATHNVQGWDGLKEACEAGGFEADEDMPTISELIEDANVSGRQVTKC